MKNSQGLPRLPWVLSLALGAISWNMSALAKAEAPKASTHKADKAVPAAGEKRPFAESKLAAKNGSTVSGTVAFTQTDKGVHVVAKVSGAKPGVHGFHIHEKGDCSSPDAKSAGGHFNPTTAPHAGPEVAIRHAGDLGNITIAADGTGTLSSDISAVQGFTTWDAIVGKSVILHDKADDLKSQPSGDAGDRIACGVIEAMKAQQAAR